MTINGVGSSRESIQNWFPESEYASGGIQEDNSIGSSIDSLKNQEKGFLSIKDYICTAVGSPKEKFTPQESKLSPRAQAEADKIIRENRTATGPIKV